MASATIEDDRPATQALRRVARYFVRRASRAFASPEPSAKAVHEARKDLKRSRTALRLLRPALGESTYRRENALLRAAAHTLNAARDAKVLTESLGSLCRRNPALRGDPGVIKLLATLQAEHADQQRKWRGNRSRLARTRRTLEAVYGRIDRWHMGRHGWSVLGPALKRIYGGGRHALPPGRPLSEDRSLHEWRKQVKYLRYALEMLAPVQPRRLARLARQAEQLSDDLGEAHDLALLAEKARDFAARHRVDLQRLLRIIGRRRDRLTLDALTNGERLYRARPREWERPLWRYWHRWHHLRKLA